MFSKQLPLGALVEFCRGVRYTLESGLTLDKAMRTQSKKGPRPIRPVAARMADRLEEGDSFHDVLLNEKQYFPPLFLSIGAVGEETGKLPEALRELEEYFRFQQGLWKKFIAQITFPVLQFFAAIMVIALLIWILGMIPGNTAISVFGLKGQDGAIKFLGIVVGGLVILTAGYFISRAVLKMGFLVDDMLLSIPILGPTLRTLAISRFCMSMGITVDAGTPMEDCVNLSLKATNNYAFASRAEAARNTIKAGEPMAEALKETRLFPRRVHRHCRHRRSRGAQPEMFQKQAELYNEDALTKLRLLAMAAGWFVWGMVAVFIIIFIFQIALQYINMINNAADGNFPV